MPTHPVRLVLLLLTLAAAPASAQMLPSGTWTGALVHGGDRHPVEATIERCATGFRVALTIDGRTAETETAAWKGGRLRFQLPRLRLPGTLLPRTLTCDLQAGDDAALAGSCTSGRTPVRLELAPPADAGFGCDDA